MLLAAGLAACGGSAPATPTSPTADPGLADVTTRPVLQVAIAAAPTLGPSRAPGAAPPSADTAASPPGASPFGSPGPSGAPDPLQVSLPFDGPTVAALQRVLDASRQRIPTPGISVAVRLADGRTWLGVSGRRRLSPIRYVDKDTVFSIASITKTFVTAVVMQLVAEGKLGLDDPLSRYLPDYPRARRITIRQLLSHTSGIANYFEAAAYSRKVFPHPGRQWTVGKILDLVGKPYCAPGRCFHYSNTNFVLLGRVIERITGRPLARVIRDRLSEPLGLGRTIFQPDDPTPRNSAHGHLWAGGTSFIDQTRPGRVLPTRSAATVAWAAGAMASNAEDLARWALALYGTDRVVRPELLAEMLDFSGGNEYGLGTRTRIFNGRRAIGHGGSLRGYEDGLWYFPREGAVIVLLSNRGLYNPDRTIRDLARVLWRHIDAPVPEYDRHRNTD